MKKIIPLFMLFSVSLQAQHITHVTDFITDGPYEFQQPVPIDSVDVNGNKLVFPAGLYKELKFYINNTDYTKAKLTVKGVDKYEVFLDGKNVFSTLSLEPVHHEMIIKYMIPDLNADTIKVSIDANHEIECTTSPRRSYSYHDVVDGLRVNKAQISPDGKYAIMGYRDVQYGGRTNSYSELVDIATGKTIKKCELYSVEWMPRTTAYFYEDKDGGRRLLRMVDARTGESKDLAHDLPDGKIVISPAEDYLIILNDEKGPSESREIFQLLEPNDRIRSFRFRTNLLRYDLNTHQCQQITFGHQSIELQDISRDGRKLLVSIPRSRLSRRPTTVCDFLIIDAQSLAVDTVLTRAEFVTSAKFSPDGKQLLFNGSAEAFNGIGRDMSAGSYSNLYDVQLFLYNLDSRKAIPLTKDFNPSVDQVKWSASDGQIYFTAKNRDYIHFYRLNPKTLSINQIPTREDVVREFSLAGSADAMVYYGVSAMNPVRAYSVNLRNKKSNCLVDCASSLLKDVKLGECCDFSFLSSRGDSIYGRYYLPPHFDATKKYPMIVNYYGGSTPTSRNFESNYPQAYYASLGYVVYVINPGGAAGFGQRYSARHVNTAGQGVAEDIIEGVKAICRKHSFINEKRVGCIGASYGGFMTQYLQTVTDIFACAVSHAGISNHASYWGSGYWGYSYSEVSMASKYPWNAKELYAGQSPLYRADKIHTPLLLTHGTADTNVPVAESLQMFTALKLLDRDVALVQVRDEDHWIIDYQKRIQWSNTIMAWFEKYLKGDATWWNTLYPKRNL